MDAADQGMRGKKRLNPIGAPYRTFKHLSHLMNLTPQKRPTPPHGRKRSVSLTKRLDQISRKKSKAPPSLLLSCDDGAMPPKIARVLGPYRDRDQWRLVVIENAGRKSMVASSVEEAEKIKADLLRLFEDRSLMTIGAALDEWLDHKRQAGIQPLSIKTVNDRLRSFLPIERTLGDITPEYAAELYLDETKRQGRRGVLRACTHHKTLIFAKGFFNWAVDSKYRRENPFAKVKALGKAQAGKRQLTEDEARKLCELAIVFAQDGDWRGLAVLVQLLMALRSAEVLALQARHLDAKGTVLIVEGTKTANARRRLQIASKPLRELLIRRCAGLDPDAFIFPGIRGGRRHTKMLHQALRRLCHLAGIPQVCPHSLRGLHSTLAVAQGESTRAVAQALGHGNDSITRKHYIAPAALDTARIERVSSALSGSTSPDLEGLGSALCNLNDEHLAALLALVEKRRKVL